MYRYGNRQQINMFPKSVEEYVGNDDPVRAYDAFIDALNLGEMGIRLDPRKVGNSEYDPLTMLKLLVYGTSYGWLSSRKLERAIHHNISFIWLMGGLKPDHKTISEFRRRYKREIKQLLKQCVRICVKLDLIEGNILFVDGTKIRANAGRGKNYTRKQYEKEHHRIDKRIDELLDECDRIDEGESGSGSFVKMKDDLADAERLRGRIRNILNEFDKEEKSGEAPKSINQTDPDSALMHSVQGSHASYNVQGVVDDKHGLFVNVDAVSDKNDRNQMSNQIEQAEEMTGKSCKVACGDAGYSSTDELDKLDSEGKTVIVPTQEQVSKKPLNEFNKKNFTYDVDKDRYTCPARHELKYSTTDKKKKKRIYRITSKKLCSDCQHYGVCTNNRKGRSIGRLIKEACKENIEKQYVQKGNQQIYKRRKTKVEHPFGHIKRNLGLTNFLLRGRESVKSEITIAGTCFNIARMITLLGGVEAFVGRICALQI